MKRLTLCVFAATLLLAAGLLAQEKAQPPQESQESARPLVPYKLQVVFNEYEAEKRVSSLPYTLTVNAGSRERGSLRMGLRVPIVTSSGAKEGAPASIQYMDVGTNIDVIPNVDGSRLNVRFERTSLYFPEGEKRTDIPTGPPTAAPAWGDVASRPVIRQFSGQVELPFRDGASGEATVATDPVSGRVLKVNVSLNVVK